MKISLHPSLLLLVLAGNTFQNFRGSGAQFVDASPHTFKGMALTDAEPSHLTSSGAEKNKRVLRDPGEHQDSPQQETSRNRNRLHKNGLSEMEAFKMEVLQASNAELSKRLDDLESCACIPTCTTLKSNDPAGLRGAILAMTHAGDMTLTLCPNTVVQWNSSDPLTDVDIPYTFTLQCSNGAGESNGCILDGGNSSTLFVTHTRNSKLTFRRIKFRNGFTDLSYGGAIGFGGRNAKLAVEDCQFEGNEATAGGAIGLVEGTLLVKGSHFVGNIAGWVGGAIWITSYPGFVSSADFTAGGNVFQDNTASSGGALYAHDDADVNICSEGSHGNTFGGNGEDYCFLGNILLKLQNTTDCGTCQTIVNDGSEFCDVILPCNSP